MNLGAKNCGKSDLVHLEIGDSFACFCEEEEESEGERKAAIKLLVEFRYRFIGEGRRDDEEAGNGGCSNGGCSGEGCDDNRSTIWTGKIVSLIFFSTTLVSEVRRLLPNCCPLLLFFRICPCFCH
jgi:hypothetical protein